MHADHYSGLTNSFPHPIYCSKATSELLKIKFPNLSNVNPLDLNVTYTLLLEQEGTLTVDVTLIDSNHCVGSVMFLFKGYFGTILHSGDFRFD